MIPTPLLGLRNRLAETILSALGDPAARRELEHLASPSPTATFAWLRDAPPEQAAIVRTRARRAADALAECPRLTTPASLDEALAAAAALFDAGLHFEVHELLEPHWTRATGAERQALQGLIQIAVGFQHLANGNLAGARSLLEEGPLRLRDGELVGLDLDPFADAVSGTLAHVGEPRSITVPPFPRH
jgi:predicted metal-dependent hydrolase